MTEAACRREDPTAFYPEDFDGATRRMAASAALRICADCPVRETCLMTALHGERRGRDVYGVRGGVLPWVRADLVESAWDAWIGAKCSDCGRRLTRKRNASNKSRGVPHYAGGICFECAAARGYRIPTIDDPTGDEAMPPMAAVVSAA